MIQRILLSLLLILPGSFAVAQSLTPFVVASAGDYFVNTNANAALSFTVGEMAMVETFQNTNNILTQGFHQPEEPQVSIGDGVDYINEFLVFPNPAQDHLNVRYRLAFPGQVKLSMVDLHGVEVLPPYEDRYIGGLHEDQLQLDRLSQGMYVLKATYDVPARGIHHISFYKINVIK